MLTSDEVDELEAPGHTAADVAFVHGMIAHHEQALAMTALVPDRAAREDLPLFAERIDVSQHDEIAQMEAWLTERGEEVVLEDGAHLAHGELMPGMLTAEELAQLEEASGRRFDRLFLQYMIRHHEGAVVMVEDLLNEGAGGQEPAIFQLAQHIASDQQIEISRMKQLLTEIDARAALSVAEVPYRSALLQRTEVACRERAARNRRRARGGRRHRRRRCP